MTSILSLWGWLKGKKTYLIGVATLLYVAFGYWQAFLPADQAIQMVSTALLAMGIRHGMVDGVKA